MKKKVNMKRHTKYNPDLIKGNKYLHKTISSSKESQNHFECKPCIPMFSEKSLYCENLIKHLKSSRHLKTTLKDHEELTKTEQNQLKEAIEYLKNQKSQVFRETDDNLTEEEEDDDENIATMLTQKKENSKSTFSIIPEEIKSDEIINKKHSNFNENSMKNNQDYFRFQL
jgi:hypothetical protein